MWVTWGVCLSEPKVDFGSFALWVGGEFFADSLLFTFRSLVLRSGRIWLEASATRSGGLVPAPVISGRYV